MEILWPEMRQLSPSAAEQSGEGRERTLGFLEGALEALPDHVALLDEGGRLMAVNQAWRQYGAANGLGYPHSGVGCNYLEVCERARGDHAQDGPWVAASLRRLVREREGSFRLDYPCHGPERRQWFQMQARCFEAQGKAFVLVAHQDITPVRGTRESLEAACQRLERQVQELAERGAEAAQERDQVLKALRLCCSVLSEEVGAAVRAIDGFSTLLRSRAALMSDAQAQDYAQRMGAAAGKQAEIIQQLLALGQVSLGNYPVGTLELEGLVRGVVESLGESLAASTGQLELVGPWPTVRANRALLELVMRQLLSNALKFVASGVQPRVKVGTEARREWVRLWVRDNGLGMAPSQQTQLFGGCYRVHGGAYSGSGLGLALVQRAVQRLGGAVGVESVVGAGSCFWVELRGSGAAAG